MHRVRDAEINCLVYDGSTPAGWILRRAYNTNGDALRFATARVKQSRPGRSSILYYCYLNYFYYYHYYSC